MRWPLAWGGTTARPSPFIREPVDRRGDEAAADAVKVAIDEYGRLTGEAEQRRDPDDEQFASELGGFVDERVGDVPVEQGDGRVVWRATYLGQWNNVAGGWLAQSVVAVLCVEVTVDRHASPMVQMIDADCAPELAGVPSDAPRVQLPTPWPPPARPTS